jgi:hypothetical protein
MKAEKTCEKTRSEKMADETGRDVPGASHQPEQRRVA